MVLNDDGLRMAAINTGQIYLGHYNSKYLPFYKGK